MVTDKFAHFHPQRNLSTQLSNSIIVKINVLEPTNANRAFQKQVTKLFDQFSPGKKQLKLKKIFAEENQITLVYCKDKENVLGIALMANYRVISGTKS